MQITMANINYLSVSSSSSITENQRRYIFLSILILLIPLTLSIGNIVDLTYVDNAVEKGAVCLDGSPAAYHFDKGVGSGTQNWLIFLEGGGWCFSPENCRSRILNKELSSHYMVAKNFTGILSKYEHLNPAFYNWNRVYVRYCDGSSYTGDKADTIEQLHYKGATIFDAIMHELLEKGMQNATNALLMGCSAGGLGAILNCNRFLSFLLSGTNVKCASDAGYFINIKDINGDYKFAQYFNRIVRLHGSTKRLPKSCISKLKPKSLCFFPQYVVPQILSPLFVINSAYDKIQVNYTFSPNSTNIYWKACTTDIRSCLISQLERLKVYRSKFLRALPRQGNDSFKGMFIDSCYAHCRTLDPQQWYGTRAARLDNKTISEAVGEWFYATSSFQKVEHEHVLPKYCE